MKQSKKNGKTRKIEKSKKLKNIGITERLLIFLTISCLFAVFVFNKNEAVNSLAVAAAGFCMIAEAAVFLAMNKKLTYENVLILLFLAGFLIRLDYVLYTPHWVRQHDLGGFEKGTGHAGYIQYFYNQGFHLPDFNPTTVSQFYHPPLHYFIAGNWMKLLTTLGMSYERAVCSIQYLTLFYSSCCMLVGERILNALKIDGKGKITAFCVIAFHPAFIMLAGSINNDMLATLFVLLALYTTIRWYQNSNIKNILLVALSIGFGMMTKLSAALVALPVAFVFLAKFINIIKTKGGWRNYFVQYCAFGVLCIPLGMWFYIRNYVLYDVPFNFVMKLSSSLDQYIGDLSLSKRLFSSWDYSFDRVFLCWVSPDCPRSEINPMVSILKTALFGEWCYPDLIVLSRILLWMNVAMVIISAVAMVYCCVVKIRKREEGMLLTIFLALYQGITYLYFVIFSIQYPHTCSMDFRYIVPTCVVGAVFIGMMINRLGASIQEKQKNGKEMEIIVQSSVIIVSALFGVFSLLLYFMVGIG